jgi:hypothetical protein
MGREILTAAATMPREAKAIEAQVISGSFGLFLGLSVIDSTGASIFLSLAHDHYCLDHFLPLLTTSYA